MTVILVTCQLDPASSPAPRWVFGHLILPAAYAVTVNIILRPCLSHTRNENILNFFFAPRTVCQPPYVPENGGYSCHPSPCGGSFSHGTVIRYYCDDGYAIKGEHEFHKCQFGKWDTRPVSCITVPGKKIGGNIPQHTVFCAESFDGYSCLFFFCFVFF